MADVINRLRWQSAHTLHRLGVAGVLTLLLALACLGLVLNNQSLERERDGLQVQANEWKPLPAMAAKPRAESRLPGEMAKRKEIPQWLAQLQGAASEHGLFIPGIQYQADTTKGYFQYRIKLTLTGAYPEVRGFLDQVLGTIPGLTLDGLRIGREEIGMQEVDATMQLSLFVKDGS
jgi:hypothetical protein